MAMFFFNFYLLVNGIILLNVVHSEELEIDLLPSKEVFETNAVVLTCHVLYLKEGQSIVWYKGNEEINENDERDRYTTFQGQYAEIDKSSEDLNIANVSRNDDDTRYTCRVYEGSREVTRSSEINLKVIAVPIWTHPYFYPKCSRLSAAVRKGDRYQVDCRTEKTDPPVRLVLKKGDHVVCNRTVSESTTCEYNAVATSSDENIKFTCDQIGPTNVPKYPASVTRSCYIGKLGILQPPNVEIKGEDVATKGKEVVLICNPSESKRCVWIYEKNEYITATERKTDNVCILRLILQPSSRIDSLNITCTAENDIGSGSDSKIIQFMDMNSYVPPVAVDVKNGMNTNTKSPLWTGVIIAITGCFAIVIVLITSVILYCGWRHFIPMYSQSGLPSPDIYSEQYNRSPYRMQCVQKCVAIQVSDEIENECADEVESKLNADSNKQDEQHYSHICSP